MPNQNDPLLVHYAQLYADRTADTFERALLVVDGQPTMQALLGRVEGDMTYAEACANAGIDLPDVIPDPVVHIEPEPDELPAVELTADEVDEQLAEAEVEPSPVLAALRDTVSGAVERGEAEPIVEQPTPELVAEREAMAEVVQLRPTAPAAENTLVRLIYRARETSITSTVLAGPADDADVARIRARLECGLWLVPEQVGLPRPYPGASIDPQYDHAWCEVEFLPTPMATNQGRSVAELATDVEAISAWDAVAFAPQPTKQNGAVARP